MQGFVAVAVAEAESEAGDEEVKFTLLFNGKL